MSGTIGTSLVRMRSGQWRWYCPFGLGINVRSRQYFIDGWHQTSPDGAQFIYDNLNKVFVTRRAILTLEDVYGERMLSCSFLPEREDWLETFCAMYTKVYAVGPTNIKWQELG